MAKAKSLNTDGARPRHAGAVNFDERVWTLLRDVAMHRGRKTGGRVSVSEVVNQLVEESRPKLERELERG
jgi:hypothetical protein